MIERVSEFSNTSGPTATAVRARALAWTVGISRGVTRTFSHEYTPIDRMSVSGGWENLDTASTIFSRKPLHDASGRTGVFSSTVVKGRAYEMESAELAGCGATSSGLATLVCRSTFDPAANWPQRWAADVRRVQGPARAILESRPLVTSHE